VCVPQRAAGLSLRLMILPVHSPSGLSRPSRRFPICSIFVRISPQTLALRTRTRCAFPAHRPRKATCYGVGPPRNARNSGPPLPWGCPIPEAKTVWLPCFENFRISPGADNCLSSATKRSPEGSKAIPRGLLRLVANVLPVPSGAIPGSRHPPGYLHLAL
jgi:hypothetical protein